MTALILCIAAFIAATLSGIIGMGGGIVLASAMAVVLPDVSLMPPIHATVQSVSNFTRTLAFLKNVRWEIATRIFISSTLAVIVALQFYNGDKIDWLKPAIGIFILCFLIYRRLKPKVKVKNLNTYLPVGFVAGFFSVWVGASGPFLAPFFFREDLEKEEIISTKAVSQLFIHLVKLVGFVSIGFPFAEHIDLFIYMIPAVIIGTFVGKKCLQYVSPNLFVRIFEVALLSVGSFLVVKPLVEYFS